MLKPYDQKQLNRVKLLGFRYRRDSYKARKADIRPSRAKLDWSNGKFGLRLYGEADDLLSPNQSKFWKLGCNVCKSFEMAENSDGYKHHRQPSGTRKRQPARRCVLHKTNRRKKEASHDI